MSFILDALKKSEAERQRQSVPGLMDASSPQRRRGLPTWAIVVGVLLALNVLVLGIVVLRQKAAEPPTAARAEPHPDRTPGAAPNALPADSGHFSPLDGTPVYAPEIPVDEHEPPAPGARRPRADPALSKAPARAQAAAEASASAQNDEVLPEISELNLAGTQTLPELHLDVHVYATSPADRFVYINMRKYREGAGLGDGLTIERIRRDGVVMNFQGLRFLLPRK